MQNKKLSYRTETVDALVQVRFCEMLLNGIKIPFVKACSSRMTLTVTQCCKVKK